MSRYDPDSQELLTFEGRVLADTDKAILFQEEGLIGEDDAVWLPLSQIEFWGGDYPERTPNQLFKPRAEVGVPRWLAEEKGLA